MKRRFLCLALALAMLITCGFAEGDTRLEPAAEMSEGAGDGVASAGTDLYLYVDSGSASYVTFRVTDDDGKPVRDARIRLTYGGYTELYGATDAKGELSAYLIRNADYKYSVSKYGFADASGSFTASGDTRLVRITLKRLNTVTLTVIDGDSPVSGAKVTINGVDVVTGENGVAEFELTNGYYQATITLPDGSVHNVKLYVGGDEAAVIDIGTAALDEAASRLYGEYLGGEGGSRDLLILYDKDYTPSGYELWLKANTDGEQPDEIFVISLPDTLETGDGEPIIVVDGEGNPVYGHRNLILSGAQLENLSSGGVERLTFQNHEFDISLPLDDLREGRIAKLIALVNERGTAEGLDAETLDSLEQDADLPYDIFKGVQMEIRVTPVRSDAEPEGVISLNEDERRRLELGYLTDAERLELANLTPASGAYRAQIIMTIDGAEVDITALLENVDVSILSDDMEPENLLDRVTLAAVYVEGDTGNTSILDTELISRLPSESLLEQYDVRVVDTRLTLSGRTIVVPRAKVYRHDETAHDAEYWLTARAAVNGLYLAVEHEKPMITNNR